MSNAEQRKFWREQKGLWRQTHRAEEREKIYQWRKQHKDRATAIQQHWYEKHGKEYYQRNAKKRRAQNKIYSQQELKLKPEQQRARRRRYYWKNRDNIRAKVKQTRLQNPMPFREIDLRRYQRNPEKRRHASRIQRAKRGGQDCYLTLKQWKELLHRFGFRCFYCHVLLTEDNRSLDHKIPLIRGGTNDIENLVPSCLRCNQQKNTKTSEEFTATTNFQ